MIFEDLFNPTILSFYDLKGLFQPDHPMALWYIRTLLTQQSHAYVIFKDPSSPTIP